MDTDSDSVFQTLKELFPQVDARILKAVAIEHPKDPDGAVESILTEVIPFICHQSNAPNSVGENSGEFVEETSLSSSVLGSTTRQDACVTEQLNDGHYIDPTCLSETLADSVASSFYDAKDVDDQPSESIKDEELISYKGREETGVEDGQGKTSHITAVNFTAECSNNDCNQVFRNHEGEAFVPSHEYHHSGVDMHANETGDALSSCTDFENGKADSSRGNGQSVHPDCCRGLSSCDHCTALRFDCHEKEFGYTLSTNQASVSAKDATPDVLGRDFHPLTDFLMPLSDGENPEMSSYVDAGFMQESHVTDAADADAEIALSTIVTRSGQICRINLVEDIIEDAKNHKETLLSAMESVIMLVKKVELQEEAAQQAKEAAARGGLKTLEKVEEIKKMLKHAKEANEMHAGEVYGEKSILATEVRELQTRLFGLSDEKDKSLSILDEMRKTLEARLAVAEQERIAAEQDMFEKEEIARGALAEQELIMEKVVQESKLLQQEAEENAKLREFLMDKGRVVDMLQGEISVICQDVESLKQKFDNHVPVSKSLLPVRQPSCVLASSSSSSVKSTTSDHAPRQTEVSGSPRRISPSPSVKSTTSDGQTEVVVSGSPRRISPSPSVGCQTPRSSSSSVGVESVGEEAVRAGSATTQKELLDEDWELFDF